MRAAGPGRKYPRAAHPGRRRPHPRAGTPPAGTNDLAGPDLTDRTDLDTRDPVGRRRVSWRSVLVFCAVAYGVLALCAAPFWVLDGGITHPLYSVVIGVGMFAPVIASVVVAELVDRTSWRDAVGLRFRGRWKTILVWPPLGLLLMLGINMATAVLMLLPACIALNALFSAITERAGGNPLPAAFAHATLNSTLGLPLGIVATSGTMDSLNWLLDTPLGLIGILLTTAVAALVMPCRGRGADRADLPEPAPEAG